MIGYDEILAHLIQAGSDALIVPSRFEPCGLTQLCALRYGAVPIVSRVGGLEDTIVDIGEADTSDRDATGFKFAPVTVEALTGTLRKANTAFHNKATWRRLQLSGLATDVSWRNRAGDYAVLYRDLMTARRHLMITTESVLIRAGMDPFAIKLIGFAAATCTTVAYAPQFIKVWKTRSARDISLGMFLVMVLGLALWLIYGLLSGDAPLVAANAITMVLAGGILFMKLRYG